LTVFAGGKAALWIDATSGAGLLYDKSQSIDRAAAGSADEKRNALEFDYTRVLGGALNPSIHGEMSMVGPRPCTPPEFRFYQPWQQERVNAPPGLIGYWQVNGGTKTTSTERINMDIFYVKNMSLRLDLQVMLRAIPTVLTSAFAKSRDTVAGCTLKSLGASAGSFSAF
jgi:hypothetical protein